MTRIDKDLTYENFNSVWIFDHIFTLLLSKTILIQKIKPKIMRICKTQITTRKQCEPFFDYKESAKLR